MANNKRDGSVRDAKEDEKMLRLFIMVPKTHEEADVRKEFEVQNGVKSKLEC